MGIIRILREGETHRLPLLSGLSALFLIGVGGRAFFVAENQLSAFSRCEKRINQASTSSQRKRHTPPSLTVGSPCFARHKSSVRGLIAIRWQMSFFVRNCCAACVTAFCMGVTFLRQCRVKQSERRPRNPSGKMHTLAFLLEDFLAQSRGNVRKR